MPAKHVFLTGGTGYIGSRLIPRLLARGHSVSALVRPGSEQKLPAGVQVVLGDPFKAESFQDKIPVDAVFIQLLGVRHPSPAKKEAFYSIDLPSLKTSADAAAKAGVERFIYLSVAQEPTKIMQDYQEVRRTGEHYCLQKGLLCLFIRPWYVAGPGHWWPILLLPLYGLLLLFPRTRSKAKALVINTINQMLNALVQAVEMPLLENAVMEVGDIRKAPRIR